MLAGTCSADLVYADDYTADGLSTYYYPDIQGAGSITPKLPAPGKVSTYQPRWDGFGRFLQTVGNATSVPLFPADQRVFQHVSNELVPASMLCGCTARGSSCIIAAAVRFSGKGC
jgi:hypothetical protein